MRETVLVQLVNPSPLARMFGDKYDVIEPVGADPTTLYPPERLATIRAVVSNGSTEHANKLMDCLPNLGLIACRGTGFDRVDVARAKQRGIIIANSPGANAYAVAEQAMALMLAAMRTIVGGDHAARSREWLLARTSRPAGYGLHKRRIGIYGMGEIGQKIAARCAAFEADVQYFSRRKIDGLTYIYHPTLESLADWCDVLQIAVRAGPETTHAVNRDILRRLGADGFVINITRGSVIDEEALVEALRANAIAGAGLDVLDNEPDVRRDLLELPNATFSPHQGGNTIESRQRMYESVVENVDAFLSGRPVPYALKLD